MTSQSADDSVTIGSLRPSTNWGEYNATAFVVQQLLGKMQTATLVRVDSCTNSGGLSPVGRVNVTPLVNQIDGQGNPVPHTTIFDLPYFRIQGGQNAIIIDPEVGDIGICVFASRDISAVKATQAQSNPGSFRQYNYADGLYIGGVLNGTPSQFIQFSSSGVEINTSLSVSINAGAGVSINSPTLTHNGVNIGENHSHGQVKSGPDVSGPPQ